VDAIGGGMSATNALLLCAHLLAAAWWVGGMAVMHFVVRPAAVSTLEPPQRLAFLAAAIGRFFRGVDVAIAVLLASGLAMVWLAGGFGAVHWSVHAMLLIGLVMMGIFGHLRSSVLPALLRAVAEQDWRAAAATLNAIRQRVAFNLGLGLLVFIVAIVGRAF
jgi:uncharacterized membrane protein